MPNVQNAGDLGLIFTNPAISMISWPRSAWWFADGAIPASNVMEHVELPTVGQAYVGAAIADTQPWTIAARSNSFLPSASAHYLFDSQTGRFVFGMSDASNYGINGGVWNNAALFPDTNNHIWFIVCDGTAVQAYLDNVSTGTTATHKGLNASGVSRWKSAYDNIANATWTNAVQKGAVYNIALTSTQRLALYTSMLNN